jgi:hypothetical protein
MQVKNPVFTPLFLRILAVICFLHLLAFFLFTIETTAYEEPPVSLPINLNAEIGLSPQSEATLSSVQVDENGLLPRYLLEPESQLPNVPDMPITPLKLTVNHVKEKQIFEGLFSQIEHTSYEEEPFKFSFLSSLPLVALQTTGSLSHLTMDDFVVPSGFFELLPSNISGEYSVVFDIKVEERKGDIFWFSLRNSSSVDFIDDLAEEVIKKIRFNPNISGVVGEGELNIVFHLPVN